VPVERLKAWAKTIFDPKHNPQSCTGITTDYRGIASARRTSFRDIFRRPRVKAKDIRALAVRCNILLNLFKRGVVITDDIITAMATRPISQATSLEELVAEFKPG